MQLTRFTDLALRVVMYVARERGRLCTMGEIAAFYQVSHEYLRKVVHKLARLGYLRSARGRGGGLALARAPASIRLGELVLAMEEDLSIVDCHAAACVLLPGCSLKSTLDRAGRAFIAALDEATLADLLGSRRMEQQFRDVARIHIAGPGAARKVRAPRGRGRARGPG